MTFRAVLITERPLERPVQFFGPSQDEAVRCARGWLKIHGKPEDRFDIMEVREVKVSEVAYEEIPAR